MARRGRPWKLTENLHSALAAAQGEFEPIKRDKSVTVSMKSGGKYSFSYAPLESILHAVTPALSRHGLSLTQATTALESGKEIRRDHACATRAARR
jgi:hypothetical protein